VDSEVTRSHVDETSSKITMFPLCFIKKPLFPSPETFGGFFVTSSSRASASSSVILAIVSCSSARFIACSRLSKETRFFPCSILLIALVSLAKLAGDCCRYSVSSTGVSTSLMVISISRSRYTF
jgi:hypothetical protein